MSTTTPQDLVGTPTAPEAPKAPTQPKVLTPDTIGGLKITGPASEGYINMLMYGESGTLKTRTAGSACRVEQMQPVILIDFEGGTLSLADSYPEVKVVRVKTWADVARLYNDLYDKNPFKTVILDSITEVQKFSMSEVMREVVNKNPDRDPDIASMREWGKSGEQMRRLVRGLRDLPCNSIFTALVNEEKNDSGQVVKIRPGLPGQMKGEVAGYMDIVSYMYKKEVHEGPNVLNKFYMLSSGTEKVTAKDRSGKLPPVPMEVPTMQEIYDIINGKRETENAT